MVAGEKYTYFRTLVLKSVEKKSWCRHQFIILYDLQLGLRDDSSVLDLLNARKQAVDRLYENSQVYVD